MRQAGGYTNVEFHLSTIDKLPLPDASVDCVISNCVLNLAPDKPAVFGEIFRVLSPEDASRLVTSPSKLNCQKRFGEPGRLRRLHSRRYPH